MIALTPHDIEQATVETGGHCVAAFFRDLCQNRAINTALNQILNNPEEFVVVDLGSKYIVSYKRVHKALDLKPESCLGHPPRKVHPDF
jgi:hypothetical protein